MPTFREAREVLLYATSENMVSDEEFALLCHINTSKTRGFEYWIYNAFNLREISDDDCVAEFRFQKNDVPKLVTALLLPDEIPCGMYNDLRVSLVEVLCVILKRLCVMHRFSGPAPRL